MVWHLGLRQRTAPPPDIGCLLEDRRLGAQLEPVREAALQVELAPDPVGGSESTKRYVGLLRPGRVAPRPPGHIQWRHPDLGDLVQQDGLQPTAPILIGRTEQAVPAELVAPLHHRRYHR